MPLRFCVHPHQLTERREQPGRWHRYRHGRRWLVRFVPGATVLIHSCPDCPARLYQVDAALPMSHLMPPWILGMESVP